MNKGILIWTHFIHRFYDYTLTVVNITHAMFESALSFLKICLSLLSLPMYVQCVSTLYNPCVIFKSLPEILLCNCGESQGHHSSGQFLWLSCVFHPNLRCSSILCVCVSSGSVVVESVPGHQLSGFQGILNQFSHPGQGPSGSPHSFAQGAPHNTLAQLQMQVDKLNPQALWQPQPNPLPWTWYQSVRLQQTVPGSLQGGSPSHNMLPQPARRFMVTLPNRVSPTSSLPGPGFMPQVSVVSVLMLF